MLVIQFSRRLESKIQAQATKESTDDYSSSDTSDEIEEDEDNVTKYTISEHRVVHA